MGLWNNILAKLGFKPQPKPATELDFAKPVTIVPDVPREQVASIVEQQPKIKNFGQRPEYSQMRALIIHPEDGVSYSYKLLMTKMGFKAENLAFARTAEEGIALERQMREVGKQPDLLITSYFRRANVEGEPAERVLSSTQAACQILVSGLATHQDRQNMAEKYGVSLMINSEIDDLKPTIDAELTKAYGPVVEKIVKPELKTIEPTTTVVEVDIEPVKRQQKTILVVDDESMILDMTSEALSRLGYSVVKAANGLKALDIVKARGYEIDLIITDFHMPGMDGQQFLACPEVEALSAKKVMASGRGMSEEPKNYDARQKEMIAKHDVDRFLGKPFTLPHLKQVVEEMIGKAEVGVVAERA